MKRAPTIRTIGDAAILDRPKVALFCSVKCPGKLILDFIVNCDIKCRMGGGGGEIENG